MGDKNFFPHPNDLLIWAYPENLFKIGLQVKALDTCCATGWDGTGTGRHCNYIDNLSLSFGFWLKCHTSKLV